MEWRSCVRLKADTPPHRSHARAAHAELQHAEGFGSSARRRAMAFADMRDESNGSISFPLKARQHYGAALNPNRTVINEGRNLSVVTVLAALLLIDDFELSPKAYQPLCAANRFWAPCSSCTCRPKRSPQPAQRGDQACPTRRGRPSAL